MHSRESLARDARALGVRAGDLVMVHASVRAVGTVVGGPDQIHLALKDAVGEAGSLMMYASCPNHYDEVGRGSLPADVEAALIEHLPAFDAQTARAQRDNGTLVEFLRTWPGTQANDHVARFVCRGPHAATLFATQPWDYAYGPDSPLSRFADLGGRILLLGSDHDQVTFLHHAEHIADVAEKRVVRFQVPVLEEGKRVWRWMEEFDTAEPCHQQWPTDHFGRITTAFLDRFAHGRGPVGDAPTVLIDAQPLLAFAVSVLTGLANGSVAPDLHDLPRPHRT
jgi:aminoglycoside 3-N-acetyltransferase